MTFPRCMSPAKGGDGPSRVEPTEDTVPPKCLRLATREPAVSPDALANCRKRITYAISAFRGRKITVGAPSNPSMPEHFLKRGTVSQRLPLSTLASTKVLRENKTLMFCVSRAWVCFGHRLILDIITSIKSRHPFTSSLSLNHLSKVDP